MGIDDQKEEREVLDSIFPDEITDLSDTSYRISISLDLPTHAPPLDSETDSLTILLNVSYPESYPDIAPNLDITAPPNTSKYALLDVAADKSQLLDSLSSVIEESLGMAMVFTLVSTLKETVEQLMADRQRQQEEIVAVAARQKEEEENRKFHGEKVTRERFLDWREKFRREMEEKERVKREEEESELKGRKSVRVDEKKMTGRQLWESGFVQKGDDEVGEGEVDGIVDGVVGMKVVNA